MEPDERNTVVDGESGLLNKETKETKERNISWCYRFFMTASLSLACFAMGLCVSVPGSTLLDLQQRVNTDTLHITYIFTARSVGHLLGAILGGYLFDRFDKHILLGMTMFLMTLPTVAAPWSGVLTFLAVGFTLQGLAMGLLDTGGTVYCIHIWGKKSGPYLQMMHFLFGIGALIAPFIAEPFLSADAQYNLTNDSTHSAVSFYGNNISSVNPDFGHLQSNNNQATRASMDINYSTASVQNEAADIEFDGSRATSKIEFAYIAIAAVCLIPSVLFFCIYCCKRQMTSLHIEPADNRNSTSDGGFRIKLMMLIFMLLFMYVGLEVTFGAFILTFTVEYLNWTKQIGVIMAGIYWGSLAAGRGLAIPISRFVKPSYMLVIDFMLILIASLTLSFGLPHYKNIIWPATAVFGLGMSSVFPSVIQWAETCMKITGKAATVMVVGSALGEMAIPVLTSYFFVTFTKMSLMYISLTVSFMNIVIFVVLQYLALDGSVRYDAIPSSDEGKFGMVDYDGDDYASFNQDSLQSRKRKNEYNYHNLVSSDH